MRFSALVPMLQTDDINLTVDWYERVLGFSVTAREDESWCCLTRDSVTIMFMHHEEMGSPHATATQYIYVDDVMALWTSIERFCRAEWGERMPYGMLEFAIKDPNGYLLSFGQRVE